MGTSRSADIVEKHGWPGTPEHMVGVAFGGACPLLVRSVLTLSDGCHSPTVPWGR